MLSDLRAYQDLFVVENRLFKFRYILGKNNVNLKIFLSRIKIKLTEEEMPHIKIEPILGRFDFYIYFPEKLLKTLKFKSCSSGRCPFVEFELDLLPFRKSDDKHSSSSVLKVKLPVLVDEIILHELVHLMWGHDSYWALFKSVKYPKLLEIAVEYQTYRTVKLFAMDQEFQRSFFSLKDMHNSNFYADFVEEFAPEFAIRPLDYWTPLDLYNVLEQLVPEHIKEGLKICGMDMLPDANSHCDKGDASGHNGSSDAQSKGSGLGLSEDYVYIPIKSQWGIGVSERAEHHDEKKIRSNVKIYGLFKTQKEKKRYSLESIMVPIKFKSVQEMIASIVGSATNKELELPWYYKVLRKMQNVYKHSQVNWLEPDPTTLWQHKIYIPTWDDRKIDVIVVIDTSGSMSLDEIAEGLQFLAAVGKIRFVGLYMHEVKCYYKAFNKNGISIEEIVDEILNNYRSGGTDYKEAYDAIIQDMVGDEVIMHVTDGFCETYVPKDFYQRLIYVFTQKSNLMLSEHNDEFHALLKAELVSYVIADKNN